MGSRNNVIAPQPQPGDAPAEQPTRKIFVVINPVSCPFGIDRMRMELERALAARGLTAEYAETCESETALPLASAAVEKGATMILAVGGDGTVMESINAAFGAGIPIGIIPTGTGNLLAVNLGIPPGVSEAVAVAIEGRSKRLDLVSIDGGKKYFAIMGGLGYDAEIMRRTPRDVKRRIGKLAYIMTAIQHLRGKRFRVHLVLDNKKVIRARVKSILIGNMGALAKGVMLFRDADPTDGLMEVGILKASTIPTFLRLVWHMLRGRPDDSPDFDRYAVRDILIRVRRPVPLELDGDDMGNVRRLHARVAPNAAYIRVP